MCDGKNHCGLQFLSLYLMQLLQVFTCFHNSFICRQFDSFFGMVLTTRKWFVKHIICIVFCGEKGAGSTSPLTKGKRGRESLDMFNLKHYLMEHDDNESWWLAEDVKGQVGYVPAAYLMIILDETQQEEESRKEGHDKRTDGTKIGGEMGQDGERRKSYSAAVIDGCERTSTIYVGDSIVRKTDRSLSKGKDVVVCLPGARIEHVTERVKKIMGRGNGGSIVVHVGTNNADKEGTTAILEKYRDLLKKTKQARVGQIIISGILPVFGNKIQGYRNSKRMAVNGMVERLCKEEDVGYMDLWDSFVGNEDMYVRDGLHLSGKGAAVFAEGLSGAVASGLGKVRYLN